MFAKHIPINGPVSKIHKEPLKRNSKKKKKKKSPVRKWTKDRHFTKDIEMENKHMAKKFYSISH